MVSVARVIISLMISGEKSSIVLVECPVALVIVISSHGFSAGWYRFMEPAGFKLPINQPSSFGPGCQVCQTQAAAWVQEGRDPTYGEGVININICFAWDSNACAGRNTGKAVACKDNSGSLFYLYFLNATPNCALAYCALGS
eukprot:GFUD01057220.1.p1 GENE.GFUD01057220.1~~GFUD01057220.1.p1  ORF type:complete len:142 (-),score=15.67 GFUD01057220.1:138-563(-)